MAEAQREALVAEPDLCVKGDCPNTADRSNEDASKQDLCTKHFESWLCGQDGLR